MKQGNQIFKSNSLPANLLVLTFSYFFSSKSVERVELRDLIDFKVKTAGVYFTKILRVAFFVLTR
jgi:hypothetical protein